MFRLGGCRIIQKLLEVEVTEKLGREPYDRRSHGPRGYRNGYKTRKLRTAEGVIEVEVPQVRDTEEGFQLVLWEALRRRTDLLERLVLEMYTRRLSTRDIEDALREATGGQRVLSRSTVTRISDVLWEEYEAFSRRDLSGYDVVYLFADAIYESLRRQAGLNEGILPSAAGSTR